MNVQELIDELQKVENKDLRVCRADSEWGGFAVTDTFISNAAEHDTNSFDKVPYEQRYDRENNPLYKEEVLVIS